MKVRQVCQGQSYFTTFYLILSNTSFKEDLFTKHVSWLPRRKHYARKKLTLYCISPTSWEPIGGIIIFLETVRAIDNYHGLHRIHLRYTHHVVCQYFLLFEKITSKKISFEKISCEKISCEKISFEKNSFEKMSFGKISFEKISFEKISFKKISF